MTLTLIQLFLVVMLVFSALLKWTSYHSFAETINELDFSKFISKVGVIALPMFELLIAASFFWETTFLFGNISLLLLLLFFLFISIKTVSDQKKLKCNCFGNLTEERFGWVTHIRIVIMIVLCLTLFIRTGKIGLWDVANKDLIYASFFSVGILMIYALGSSVFQKQKEVN